MQRVLKRAGWNEKRYLLTKKQQLEDKKKKALADIVIYSDRGKRYVYKIIFNILKKSNSKKNRSNDRVIYNFQK